MAGRTQNLDRRTQVAWVASHIANPVYRLRFLRAATADASWLRSRSRLGLWVLCTLLLPAPFVPLLFTRPPSKPERPPVRVSAPQGVTSGATTQPVAVWQVDSDRDAEIYSNGLRIGVRFTVAGPPRVYRVFARNSAAPGAGVVRSQPAGIVFHTTESCQAPFAEQETPAIERLGEALLEYVQRNRSYHYVIDRFGRVYRVVAESDVAFHAGHSVWADRDWLYLDLNRSFLGVAFEAQTSPGHADGLASPAQLRAAAMLTEMLRSRYHIAADDCVTHAQVSVNPSNLLIGYHTDWAAGFPFGAVGLPDNYQLALPSVWAFGFGYDPVWFQSGSPLSAAIERAELEVLRGAAAAGLRPAAYRRILQKRFRAAQAEARAIPSPSPPPADTRSPASPAVPPAPFRAAHKRTRRPAHAGI